MAWYLCGCYDNETLEKVGTMGIGLEGTTLTPLSACTETCGLCSNAGQLWVAVGRV